MNSRKSSLLRFRWPALLAGLLGAATSLLQAQTVTFDSGSNGSLGDVVITNDTQIVLPADGILHYKSFTLLNDASLSFIKNAYNTPVYLLSQGGLSSSFHTPCRFAGCEPGRLLAISR